MKAVVLEAPRQVVVKEVPRPEPAPGEVIVEVKACSICGTDGKMYKGEFLCPYPITPGHEFAGVVVQLGPGVDSGLEGLRVGVDYMCPCGECHYCKIGLRNHCVHHKAIGQTINGGFAEYVAVPTGNVYPIPDDLSFEEAASLTVMAGSVHAMRRLKMNHGDRVLILGAGAAGLELVQMCRLGGASIVVSSDLIAHKLEMAGKMGATQVVLADELQTKRLQEIAPFGFDIVIEATGTPAALEKAFEQVTHGGKIFVFGISPTTATATIKPFEIWHKEVEKIGSRSILFSATAALDLLQSKRIDVKSMISHRFPLDRFPEALQLHLSGKDVLKVIVNPTASS